METHTLPHEMKMEKNDERNQQIKQQVFSKTDYTPTDFSPPVLPVYEKSACSFPSTP
jgi:hypothetical protein